MYVYTSCEYIMYACMYAQYNICTYVLYALIYITYTDTIVHTTDCS